MIYYMAKIDVYDYYDNTQIYTGQLFTETEHKRRRFSYKDTIQLFHKIETPKENTYKLYGIRKIKDYKKVIICT